MSEVVIRLPPLLEENRYMEGVTARSFCSKVVAKCFCVIGDRTEATWPDWGWQHLVIFISKNIMSGSARNTHFFLKNVFTLCVQLEKQSEKNNTIKTTHWQVLFKKLPTICCPLMGFGFTLLQAWMNPSGMPVSSQSFINKNKNTHRHPGAGSDSGNKISLPTGSLPLDLLEAVEGSREVVEQALSLDLSLPLERERHKTKGKTFKGQVSKFN